jgi:hypothetical protein
VTVRFSDATPVTVTISSFTVPSSRMSVNGVVPGKPEVDATGRVVAELDTEDVRVVSTAVEL